MNNLGLAAFKRKETIITFLIACALSVFPTLSFLKQSYTTWTDFDSVWGTIPALLFPILAGISAGAAQRHGKPNHMTMLPVGAVPVFLRHLIIQAPLVISAGLGTCAGVAPMLWKTARTATDGSPQLSVIIVFFGFFLASCTLGMAVAAIFRSLVAVPVAAVIGFMWGQTANYFGDDYILIAPFRPYPQDPGQFLSVPVSVGNIVFAVVAIGALLGVTRMLTNTPVNWTLAGACAVILTVTVGGSVVLAEKKNTPLWGLEAQPPRECRELRGADVCVHRAHLKDLDDISTHVESVLHNYGESHPSRLVLIDSSLLLAPRKLAKEVVIIRFTPGETNGMGIQLAQHLTSFWACANKPGSAGTDISAKLQDWLVLGPRGANPEHTRKVMWNYIRNNQQAIAECRATPESWPLK